MVHKGLKVCVVFEGRDGAGKGGAIKAITERVTPRVFRVDALLAPTKREKPQMYVQRYLPHLPASGEVVLFDRSWYNRAGAAFLGFPTHASDVAWARAVAGEGEQRPIERSVKCTQSTELGGPSLLALSSAKKRIFCKQPSMATTNR